MLNKPLFMRQLWREGRWLLLGALWLVGLLLGYAGLARFSQENALNWSAGDVLYRTLQLIILESGAVNGPVNWMLEIARFLLPALTAYTVLEALSNLFREQMQWLRLWRLRNHIIICGLGRKGARLADELIRLAQPVVIIEKQPEHTKAAELQRRGAILLSGNATDRDMLISARIAHARYLLCLLGDDSQNLQVAFQAYQLASQRRKGILTCVIHLNSSDLLNLIKRSELAFEPGLPFQVETFHSYTHAARWLIQKDYDGQDHASPSTPPDHLLVIGLGRLGERLVVQAAYKWYRSKQDHPLTITILDRRAEQRTAELLQTYPPLGRTCRLTALNVELSSVTFIQTNLTKMQEPTPFQRVYICLSNPVLSLEVCWSLLEMPAFRNIPIWVRMERQSGLFELLQKPLTAAPFPGQVIPFDPLESACSAELVMGGLHEVLARELHEHYLQGIGVSSTALSWERLTEEEKDANRQQAARIYAVLSAAGYHLRALQDWDAEEMTFPAEEVERMARLEHDLWCQAKRKAGWRPGPQKDAAKRTHPCLVPWEQLPEDEREKNRNFIRQLPALLARLDFQIERQGD